MSTASINSTSSDPFAALNTRSSSGAQSTDAATAKDAQDRFLKLLVTQLKNQDPMNPTDNAQMTSQMAQISTVSGIEKLNTTVQGLNGQFVQMQALQGASLVGKNVVLKGDKLSVADGVASGTYELAAAATNVKAEMLSPAGLVVDTLNLGAHGSGRQDFVWPGGSTISESAGYRFRLTAANGSTAVASTTLIRDKVNAVNTGGSSLSVELARSGSVPYSAIAAIE